MSRFTTILCFTLTLSVTAQRSDFYEIDFAVADNIAQQYKGEALYNLPILAHQLTIDLDTDVERFRAIYYWVTHNIRGAYYLNFKNEEMRETYKNDPEGFRMWNEQFKKLVFGQLLKHNETLCTGYAYLIKELSNLAGLDCEIIYGNDPTSGLKVDSIDAPSHSWNAVKLHGKWYVCDATWSAGFMDLSTLVFVFKYEEDFFLMEPLEFIKTHRPTDEKWTLLDASL